MINKKRRIGPWGLIFSILTAVSLTACGPSRANSTPTMSAEEIFTAAYNTLQAQQATLLASTPPTGTPTSSPSPTVPPPSPLATLPFIGGPTLSTGGASGCDNAAYVADVTIPDGMTIAAGKSFDKTWTLQNTGSCAWTTGYKLAFFGGEQMGGSASAVSTSVSSGGQTNITVKMTAPSSTGNYTGTWRMQNANGVGFGGTVTVVIKVGSGGPTATKGPTLSPDELTGTASAMPTAGDTVTISGKTGAVSVTIHWEGKGIDNTQEFSGTWSIVVPAHWDGTVTPSKGNVNKWTFSPESYTYTDVTTNKLNQDFVATPP